MIARAIVEDVAHAGRPPSAGGSRMCDWLCESSRIMLARYAPLLLVAHLQVVLRRHEAQCHASARSIQRSGYLISLTFYLHFARKISPDTRRASPAALLVRRCSRYGRPGCCKRLSMLLPPRDVPTLQLGPEETTFAVDAGSQFDGTTKQSHDTYAHFPQLSDRP